MWVCGCSESKSASDAWRQVREPFCHDVYMSRNWATPSLHDFHHRHFDLGLIARFLVFVIGCDWKLWFQYSWFKRTGFPEEHPVASLLSSGKPLRCVLPRSISNKESASRKVSSQGGHAWLLELALCLTCIADCMGSIDCCFDSMKVFKVVSFRPGWTS